MEDIPSSYVRGSNQYSSSSAYWAFRGLFSLGQLNHDEYMSYIDRLWGAYEKQFINEQGYLKQMLIGMYQSDHQLTINFSKNYSAGIIYQAVGVANKQRNNLMTKITDQKDPSSA